MDNCKAKANYTLQQVIIMSESFALIKNKEEDLIIGLESNPMCMRVSLKAESEMVEVHFGGQMEANIKANLKMECKVDLEYYIDRAVTNSTKVYGIMVCSMEKAFNISTTENVMRALLNRTNSTEMGYSTKMTQ